MDINRRSVIIIYNGKEIDRVVVCDTREEAQQLLGNLLDTKRPFEAHHAELYDPEVHLMPVQPKLLG